MEVIVAPEPMDYEIRGMYRFATLREDSGLAEAVRGRWPENPRLLMIAAEPDNDTYTENLAMDLATALVTVSYTHLMPCSQSTSLPELSYMAV